MYTSIKLYRKLILVSAAIIAVTFSACVDDLHLDQTGILSSSDLAARRIEEAKAPTSRAETRSDLFEIKTKYNLFAYPEDPENEGNPKFDDPLFENLIGTENDSHYIELDRNINEDMHIFGFTDATESEVEDFSPTSFNVCLKNDKYIDYLSGSIHYQPSGADSESSYTVIPFKHIMAQLRVKVIQYGEVVDENLIPAYTDLKIKEIRLTNASIEADYNLQQQRFDNLRDPTSRSLWTSEDENGDLIPAEIADSEENVKPVTTNLVMPQEPSKEDKKMILELVVCGTSAEIFKNNLNIGAKEDEDGNLIIPLKLDDNSEDKNPLQFKSNYSYTLVVTFQADKVRVITIAPQIYPFFRGEGTDDVNDFDLQILEQPSVFDNLQWCDRYTGADLGNPTSIEDFQRATGFYYQKNRTIPFFPSTYKWDDNIPKLLDDKYWPVEDISSIDKGDVRYEYSWLSPLNLSRGWLWTGGGVYYKYGGEWEPDVDAAGMFKKPAVKPIVSFYIPEEVQVTGLNNYLNKDWSVAQNDGYIAGQFGRESVFWNNNGIKEGSNRYCSTVKDFVNYDTIIDGKKSSSINKYFAYNPVDGKWGTPINKRLNYVMHMTKESITTTWDSNTTDLPCPPGWRLPTKQDFLSVFPGSAAAGNITFLNFLAFGSDPSTVAPIDPNITDVLRDEHGKEILEIYVETPFNVVDELDPEKSKLYPPLRNVGWGYLELDADLNKRQGLCTITGDPDPSTGDKSEYVISKREFTKQEYSDYDVDESIISETDYKAYHDIVAGKIARPKNHLNATETIFKNASDPKWGVIYAIKKVGTNQAYRLRYHIKGIFQKDIETGDTLEAYVLVVEQYKAKSTDHLLYKIEHINQKHYFLNYSWDYPDATLYFPITGMVSDAPMVHWMPEPKSEWVSSIFNYGTETILLSCDYENDGADQAVLRIKIGGTNTTNQFIFQGMARFALGGQVRAVRTFLSGEGD